MTLGPTVPPLEKNLSAAPSECADQYSRRARQRGGERVGAALSALRPAACCRRCVSSTHRRIKRSLPQRRTVRPKDQRSARGPDRYSIGRVPSILDRMLTER
jgi:hypothetical protein